jgi:hypothetical protein
MTEHRQAGVDTRCDREDISVQTSCVDATRRKASKERVFEAPYELATRARRITSLGAIEADGSMDDGLKE